jgi:alkanesulfonate monooxygenase
MSLKFHWFVPTSGDGRAIAGRGHSIPLVGTQDGPRAPQNGAAPGRRSGAASAARPPDIEYLAQFARSAEQLGFEAVLTPTGTWCEDAWLVTAALTRDTQRLKYLVAFRPAARQSTSQIWPDCSSGSRRARPTPIWSIWSSRRSGRPVSNPSWAPVHH